MSEPAGAAALRVLLRTGDPVRRRGLAAMVEGAGHLVVTEAPDVVLCDLARDAAPPAEAEAPVVVLTSAADTRRAAGGRTAARGHRDATRPRAAGGGRRSVWFGAGRVSA